MSTVARQPIAEPAPEAQLLELRKELLLELGREPDRRSRMFASRYFLTCLPLALAAVALGAAPGIPSAILFAIVAGFTQNALGVYMHEGSHFFFHPDRRTNDFLANALVCLPIFNTVAGYRGEHLAHHQGSGTPQDPYHELYGLYRRPADMVRGLLRDVAGVTAVRAFLRRYSSRGPQPREASKGGLANLLALGATQATIALALWALTGWFFAWLVLWVVPLMTIPVAVNRVRTFVEHYPGRDGPAANRTTPAGLFDYLCIAPYGYSHHFEHHLAPTIPYFHLARAHRFLESRGARLGAHQCNDGGYLGSFFRLMGDLSASAPRAS